MNDDPQRHGWWQTLTGGLTIVGGLITGLGGVLWALQEIGTLLQKEPTNITRSTVAEKPMPSGKGFLVNAHSGLCLTVAGGVTDRNTIAVQYLCDGDPSRSWNLKSEGADTLKIINSNSGLCLSIDGKGTGKNITALQTDCDNDASQRWRYEKLDDSTFRLVNTKSRLCLTIAGGGKDNNTAAVQYPCDGDPSREWKFRAAP